MRKKRLIKANAHLSEALSMQCIMTLICTGYIQKNMDASPSAFNKTLLNIVLVATILNLLYLISGRVVVIIQMAKDLKRKPDEDPDCTDTTEEEEAAIKRAEEEIEGGIDFTSEEVFSNTSDNED